MKLEKIFNIRKEDPNFNEKELLDYTKFAIKILYEEIKKEGQVKTKIKCKEKVIEKLVKNKRRYRIIDEIDRMNIQFAGIDKCEEIDNKQQIKVRLSVYFYDNTRNNDNHIVRKTKENYWNDIWIVTYQKIDSNNIIESSCKNCGANMMYDYKKEMYECEYCGNMKIYVGKNINWEITDIQIKI